MNKTPFFSIIIPTLNEEAYVPRLLKNIRAQHERSFEVIVVDGGSVDKTIEVVTEFASEMPLTVISTQKGNVCAQRNRGAQKARGEYVVFLDADVQIPKRFLSEIHQKIRDTDAAFITTYVRPDSRHVYDRTIARLINLTFEVAKLLERPFVGGFDFIVKKSLFQVVGGFDEGIVHAEDYDLAVKIGKQGHEVLILRSPRLTFSLRRFRHDGRLTTLRKNAIAAVHVVTKGPITKEIFSYPMGGLWYKLKKKEQIRPQSLDILEDSVRKFMKLFTE